MLKRLVQEIDVVNRDPGALRFVVWILALAVAISCAVLLLSYIMALRHLHASTLYAIVTSGALCGIVACESLSGWEFPSFARMIAFLLIAIGIALLSLVET
jgi:multidrug transporter EmrE-like cation transporter